MGCLLDLHKLSLAEPGINDRVCSLSLWLAELAEVESNLASAWANRELGLVRPGKSSSGVAVGMTGDLLQEEKPNDEVDIIMSTLRLEL